MNMQNRELDHIGVATPHIEKTSAWLESLGFKLKGAFMSGKVPCRFFTNGHVCYELYQPEDMKGDRARIEHVSYVSHDIEADYAQCMHDGFTCTTDGIESLDFWENGCRFFKIGSPTGEEIEFDQLLPLEGANK